MSSWLPRLALSIRARLPERLRHVLRLGWHLLAKGQPSMAIPPDLLAECRVCASRNELVNNLPRGGRVAEVGTYRGAFARHILATCTPTELHLIDIDFRLDKGTRGQTVLPLEGDALAVDHLEKPANSVDGLKKLIVFGVDWLGIPLIHVRSQRSSKIAQIVSKAVNPFKIGACSLDAPFDQLGWWAKKRLRSW